MRRGGFEPPSLLCGSRMRIARRDGAPMLEINKECRTLNSQQPPQTCGFVPWTAYASLSVRLAMAPSVSSSLYTKKEPPLPACPMRVLSPPRACAPANWLTKPE